MRSRSVWPVSLREWLPGLALSVPFALALLLARSAEPELRAMMASVAIVLSIPWLIPATMLLAVCSAPLYMWLHTQGPAPQVLDWLGGVTLVAAVVGCHVNAALLAAWRRARSADTVEFGLRDFLFRHDHGQDHRLH